jgi:hypothetical protein
LISCMSYSLSLSMIFLNNSSRYSIDSPGVTYDS